jgi:two-component system nitrogen regulation sensor histidine kinase NtrY
MAGSSATSGGGEVAWHRDDAQVSVRIDDEGPGLANTENLFVPFYTTKPGGLVLARQIAEAHGGSLTLENRQGEVGCEAVLRFPV